MLVKARVAVVTGGASGMGRSLVVQLAAAGAHVACCDVDVGGLDETARLARAANGAVRVTTHRVDVSARDEVLAFAQQVLAAHEGRVHLLFCNAGITAPGALIMDAKWSDAQIAAHEKAWQRCFDIDFFGVLHCIRAFLPHIVRQEEGYVIVTSSVNSFITWPEHSCYTAR
jgi:NAD(P)-dependent dehydrogenase (short-subunit alcohol dehydrogenase family)